MLEWATRRNIQVLGIDTEISRLNCAAVGVTDAELGRRADLVVSLGGDGTMLRAMRLADRQRAPVLGVNLGKLGFLAEVDVPDLPSALTAVDAREFTVEPRMALDADHRRPGRHSASARKRSVSVVSGIGLLSLGALAGDMGHDLHAVGAVGQLTLMSRAAPPQVALSVPYSGVRGMVLAGVRRGEDIGAQRVGAADVKLGDRGQGTTVTANRPPSRST